MISLESCLANGGSPSLGSACLPSPCAGACCGTGGCAIQLNTEACAATGGVYQGLGTTCTPSNWCASACCHGAALGSCVVTTHTACSALPGPVQFTVGNVCEAAICNNSGACCAGGVCTVVFGGGCPGGVGVFTLNTPCSTTLCPPVVGACCRAGQCTLLTQANCLHVWRGPGTFCLPNLCCPADFNRSGAIGVQDIFDFLAAWFEGNSAADFNHANGLSVQDIFDFLAAYFSGCP